MTWLWLCLGAAVGAPARFLADHALRARFGADLPRGTLLVNVVGSFVLGLVTGLGPPEAVLVGVGAGFCGALTTWSTLGWETLALAEGGRARAAVANVLISVVAGLAAATLGHLAGTGIGV